MQQKRERRGKKQGNKKRAMKSICTNTRYSSDYKQVIMHSSKHVNSFQTTGNLELQEGQLFEKLVSRRQNVVPSFWFLYKLSPNLRENQATRLAASSLGMRSFVRERIPLVTSALFLSLRQLCWSLTLFGCPKFYLVRNWNFGCDFENLCFKDNGEVKKKKKLYFLLLHFLCRCTQSPCASLPAVSTLIPFSSRWLHLNQVSNSRSTLHEQ